MSNISKLKKNIFTYIFSLTNYVTEKIKKSDKSTKVKFLRGVSMSKVPKIDKQRKI